MAQRVNDNENSVFAFLGVARDHDNCIAVISNFTPVPREAHRVGLPKPGVWREVLNSDAALYGGGNLGNGGSVFARDEQWGGRPYSGRLLLPPLSTLMLKPE